MAKLSVGSSSHSPVGYDAFKITLGQHLDVLTPHQVLSVLEVRGHHSLTGGKLIRYQALLMDILDITLKVCQTLNLVTLLSLVESGDLLPQCIETLEQIHYIRSDLLDELRSNDLLMGAVL